MKKENMDIIAWTQNKREEVRIIGDGQVAGCINAETGTHQTTYILLKGKVLHGTKTASPKPREGVYYGQIGISIRYNNHFWYEVSGTLMGGMKGDNLPVLIEINNKKGKQK